jgi:hypothetical protein
VDLKSNPDKEIGSSDNFDIGSKTLKATEILSTWCNAIAGVILMKRKKFMNWLVVIGIIFIGIGTLLTIIGQSRDSEESNKLLQEKSDKITELSQENIRLSSELSKLNQEIAATITGGDSFCYLFPFISIDKKKSIDFKLFHMGNYPVYDVFISAWDGSCLKKIANRGITEEKDEYEEWLEMKSDPKDIMQKKEYINYLKEQMQQCLIIQETLGTITPIKSTNIMDLPMITFTVPPKINPNEFKQVYDVNIVARNGEFRQTIEIDIKNKKLHVYSKVVKVSGSSQPEVLREYESLDSDVFMIKIIE